ncbi:hypothetical protein HaLaN_13612 [Haematococcus lacustris]|uniref:Uncharacterized protein n=1 Tax=Haematococcus lacustris TaxID=44745 RepID=A0A699ZDL0_HAELA|nr:hypothetical protein HaLaN_13612 [Haematococcus lacustris]
MNLQLASTEEYIDGQNSSPVGQYFKEHDGIMEVYLELVQLVPMAV